MEGVRAAGQHMGDVHLSPLGNLQVPRTTKDAGAAPPQPAVLSQHTPFPSRPMMLITFTARCCQCVKNKLLSPLWGLLFFCHGVSLLSHHSRLLHCACIGHLLQAEEPGLDEHLSLAMCQPSGQGRQPGPSATQVPGMQPPPSQQPL